MSNPINLTEINVNIHGSNNTIKVKTGTTGNQFLTNPTYVDALQIPKNVEVHVNGLSGRGDIPLASGDVLSFQTKASSKAVAA